MKAVIVMSEAKLAALRSMLTEYIVQMQHDAEFGVSEFVFAATDERTRPGDLLQLVTRVNSVTWVPDCFELSPNLVELYALKQLACDFVNAECDCKQDEHDTGCSLRKAMDRLTAACGGVRS